jgi:hypothetical protein
MAYEKATSLLILANKRLDQGDLFNACRYYTQAQVYRNIQADLESTSITVWENRVSVVQDIVRQVYTVSKAFLQYGSAFVGPLAGLIIDSVSLPVDYAVNESLYGEQEATQQFGQDFISVLVTDVFLQIPVPSLHGKTLAEWTSKGVDRELRSAKVYDMLNEMLKDSSMRPKIVSALRKVAPSLADALLSNLADKIMASYRDALNNLYTGGSSSPQEGVYAAEVGKGPSVIRTAPVSDAARVSPGISAIIVDYDESITLLRASISVRDAAGAAIPIDGVVAADNRLVANIGMTLKPGTSYTATIAPGSVINLTGLSNEQYSWQFTTEPVALSVGINAVVANTGGVGLHVRSNAKYLADGTNVLGTLSEGTSVTVIGGPQQSDGYTWWKITDGGLRGWSAVGDWLSPLDSAGLRIGADVRVANTSGVGLNLRDEPGLSANELSALVEGTQMTIIDGPFYQDGYLWWNLGGPSGTGFSAVAYWLVPAAMNGRPIVDTGTASGISGTSATLGGNVNANGSLATFYFECGTDPSLATPSRTNPESAGSGTSSLPVSSIITGLNPNTTYYYHIVAENDSGTSRGAIVPFVTGPQTTIISMSVDPTALDFGTVAVGNAQDLVLRVTNLTSSNGTLNASVSSLSDPFAVVPGNGDAPFSLLPGQSKVVSIRFKPAVGGEFASLMQINSNASSSPTNISLHGKGQVLTVGIQVSPSPIIFNNIPLSTYSHQAITISNPATSTGNLNISVKDPSAPFSICCNTSFGIGPGGSGTIWVYFGPQSQGTFTDKLEIASNAPTSPTIIPLIGTTPITKLSVSPTSVDYGALRVGEFIDQTVMITNDPASTGYIDGNIIHLSNLGNSGSLSVASGETTFRLSPGKANPVVIRFSPTSSGIFSGKLVVEHFDDQTNPVTVELKGTGIPAALNISGHVTDAVGNGVGSVTMTLTGSLADTTQTNTDGLYVLGGLPAGGSYTVTPSGLNSTFSPPNQTFSNLTKSQTADFTQVPITMSGDFNGDGKPDILWRNSVTGEVVVWLMDGTKRLGAVSLGTMPDPNWKIVGIADFNSDGKPDLLWRNIATGTNAVWYLDGTTRIGGADLEAVPDLSWKIVAVADFNSDGKPDLLWRNSATGDISVWFMNGITRISGSYVSTVSDSNWKIVAVADFDSDGNPDILWRNSSTGSIAVWFMNGTTFIRGADLEAVPDLNWRIVGAADLNGDGRPDILWRNSVTGDNAVWYMNGTTRISGANLDTVPDINWLLADFSGELLPRSKVLGPDFNGDGKPDILWLNASTGEILVWFMDGTKQVGSASIGTMPDPNWRIVGIADFNSDGQPDLLWRNSSTGEVSVWFLNGTTRTSAADLETVSDLDWRIVGVADFNSDGKPDILWRNSFTGNIALWFMDGITHTSASFVASVQDPNWKIVGVADFNSDGKPDILWRNSSTGQNYLWFMDTTTLIGEASIEAIADTNWKLVAIADFNADGQPDLLWRNSSTGQNSVWFMNGASHSGDALLEPVSDTNWLIGDLTGELPHQAKIIGPDFNGDGRPDIVWRNLSTGQILVWFMDQTHYLGCASLRTVSDLNWKIVGFADFNSDGKPDILWRNSSTGQNYLWFMNGTSLIGETFLASVPDTNWKIVGAADFNGDGRPDILWRNSSTGQNYLWFMNGSMRIGEAWLDSVPDTNWRIVGAADFNGDAKPDILWRNVANGSNYVWFMNGSVRIGETALDAVPDLNWKLVAVGDFNADRKPDLLWRNSVTGVNCIWLMNGTSFTAVSYIDTVTDPGWQIMPQGN